MSTLFWTLSGIGAYLFAGVTIGMILWKEWNDDTPSSNLSCWGRMRRLFSFPLLSTPGDDWPSRKNGEGTPLVNNVGKSGYLAAYSILWPIFRAFPTFVSLMVSTGMLIRAIAGGLEKLVNFIVNLLSLKSRVGSSFLEGKEKLIDIEKSLSAKEYHLQRLVCEGVSLIEELGGNGAAGRCRILVDGLRNSLSETRERLKRVGIALESLEEEERNFKNLSRLLGFYRKVAKSKEGRDVNISEVETAMATALYSCEKILGKISSEEVELIGEDLPPSLLDSQVKDFQKEKGRLREAQERALASGS